MLNLLRDVIMSPKKRSEMKGYKITDNQRSRKFGIGANSLQVLKEKAQLKFPIKDLTVYLSTDGSEVSDDDYFYSLDSQTLFIIAGPHEVVTTDAELQHNILKDSSPLLLYEEIMNLLIEKRPETFCKLVANFEKNGKLKRNNNCKTELSLKVEHPEWFAGQEERHQTKEEALIKRAQDRMRGYYYKTKNELTHNQLYRQSRKARLVFDAILEKFRYLLIACDYFSMIFNRKCSKKHEFLQQKLDEIDAGSTVPSKRLKRFIKEFATRNELLDEWSVSLCTDKGDFYCQGSYSSNGSGCQLDHTINPYESHAHLLLFQVWNLDHQIELSRTILPNLVENVRQLVECPATLKCDMHDKPVLDISVLEYFLEIFSVKNLKLVHIVCHDKIQRANKSNGRLICEECSEYKIVKDLMEVRCPEEDF